MKNQLRFHAALMCGAAFTAMAGSAFASEVRFDIRPQPLAEALGQFSAQSGESLLFTPEITDTKTTRGLVGEAEINSALDRVLAGTGLTYRRSRGAYLIIKMADVSPTRVAPISALAAETVSGSAVEGLVVTAQKRREQIQDVPIAISAFNADALQAQKIEGGFDLLKAIPNVTFSKNNFSGYNFSIRGIGTKAISVTTDPGVAVSFNDTTLIRNRLFEQEYFDVERVEVLRGPQGTLYGRNATSGVINVVSEKPELDAFEGSLKGEVGNYQTKRLSAMVNVPLIDDVLAVRFAGALTEREGYNYNLYNKEHVDGRDLWSGRLTIGFEPTERFRADLIWERFNEDDDRSRTGKQLCTHDYGPESIGGTELVEKPRQFQTLAEVRGSFSQGCLPGSLYDDAAFAAPNGLAIPFVYTLGANLFGSLGYLDTPAGDFSIPVRVIPSGVDPYGDVTQSHDLRTLYSQIKPIYRARADVFELNMHFDVTEALTAYSSTAYNKDEIYASQDFNRYSTFPVFQDTSTLLPSSTKLDLLPGGIFCDPQLGCSNTIVGQDLSRAKSSQFSQEFRIQSSFSGPLNFSAGTNYTRYNTIEDYYVFFNAITLATIVSLNGGQLGAPGVPSRNGIHPDCTMPTAAVVCVPIETNPISEIQDFGHNYFLSRNPYKLESWSVFGEMYWQISNTIKLTGGLRYTDDTKVFTPIPSQTALTPREHADFLNPFLKDIFLPLPFYGTGYGYPAEPDIKLDWQEVTGRFGGDWTPDLSFTDQTMIYAFYSRGYKGGGMNPPRVGLNYAEAEAAGIVYAPSAPLSFRPEFVDAFEVGVKNTMLGEALVLNGNFFLYDYQDYQVSKIVDRTANNENFDAKIWGLEFETVFRPSPNLRFNASFGYLHTELADGSKSIDIMNRTAGHTDWAVVKPALTLMSNCIVPADVVAKLVVDGDFNTSLMAGACPGGNLIGGNFYNGGPLGGALPDGSTYNPADYPEANYGAGFDTDVSGNELPNSPHFTVTFGAQYSWDLFDGNWSATVRGDAYWQSQQWARVYQLPIDKLHAWNNANLSFWLERPADDLKLEFYIKNLFDETPITDTFINSDDTALTTNIFVLDPRLIGLSIKKGF